MKNKYLLSAVLGFATLTTAWAQNPVQVKYANTITVEDLTKHLTYLASDEMKGRDTGSPEGKIAANYLADFYKGLGLTAPNAGSYFQNVPLVSSRFTQVSLQIGKTKLVENTDFVFTGDGNLAKAVKTDLVFLGLVSDENLAKVDVKGKLVGLWAVGVRSNDLVTKVMNAGAAGIVIVTMEGQANFDRIANRYKSMAGNGRIGFDQEIKQRPVFMVSSDKMAQLFGASVEH